MNRNIIRVVKDKDNPYVMLNKEFLSNEKLSWKAKGILTYLLSKPDNWKVLVEDLIKQSTDGEKSTRSGLSELKEQGYLQKYPVYKNNTIDRWENVVHEKPCAEHEKIKSVIELENGKIQINLLCQNRQVVENEEVYLLAQNVQVGNVQVGNEGLIINDSNNNKINNNYEEEEALHLYTKAKGRKLTNLEKEKILELVQDHTLPLVNKAIEEMSLRAEKVNLKYLSNTLTDWNNRGLTTIEAVEKALAEHEVQNLKIKENKEQSKKRAAEGYTPKDKPSPFCDYDQRNYDYKDLENKLLGWDKQEVEG